MEEKKVLAKTTSGFEIELSRDVFNDAELMEMLIEMDKGSSGGLLIFKVAQKVLGTEGKKKLYDHLRLPDGRVPVDALDDALGELMNCVKDAKNSSSSPD